MNNKIYIGQYHKNDTFLKYNQIRYKTYCMVLDQLCYFNSLIKTTEIKRSKIEDYIFTSIKRNKENEVIVNTAIASMLMSGLISEDNNNNFELTSLGIEAYAKQTYHLVAANLAEAKASRNLSTVAIIIAIVTMLITVVSVAI